MESRSTTTRTPSSTRRHLAVAMACAAVIAAAWWLHSDRRADEPRPAPVADRLAPTAATVRERPVAARAPLVAAIPASAAASGTTASLAAQVELWSRSADTRDAMRAYDAVVKCLLARRREHALPEKFEGVALPPEAAAQICADLRSDQIQNRMQWLERAASEGERDAAGWIIQEGPSGDGLLRDLDAPSFDNDMTADWLRRRDGYIDLALRRCDTGLVPYLTRFARGVPADDAVAQAYWLGRLVCPGGTQPTLVPLADDPLGQRLLQGLRHGPDGQRLPGS